MGGAPCVLSVRDSEGSVDSVILPYGQKWLGVAVRRMMESLGYCYLGNGACCDSWTGFGCGERRLLRAVRGHWCVWTSGGSVSAVFQLTKD